MTALKVMISTLGPIAAVAVAAYFGRVLFQAMRKSDDADSRDTNGKASEGSSSAADNNSSAVKTESTKPPVINGNSGHAAAQQQAPAQAATQPPAPSPPSAPSQPGPKVSTGGGAVLARLRQQRAASAAAAAQRAAEAAATRTVTFLYASQTGTAEEIANSLHDEALSKGFKSSVSSLNDWGADAINAAKTPVLVIVASSTGDGDCPDNGARAYLHLKRPADAGKLRGVQYTVMGLGDSNYTKFMHVSRTLKRRLAEQGAAEFYTSGEADEVDGLEDIVDAWRDGMWAALSEAVAPENKENSAAESNGPSAAALPEDYTKAGRLLEEGTIVQGVPAVRLSRVAITLAPPTGESASESADSNAAEPSEAELAYRDPEGRYSDAQPFWATVQERRYLTAKECQKRVLHLSLDVSDSGMRFEAGDAISVKPANDPALVAGLLEHLQLDGGMVVSGVTWTDGSAAQPLPHLARRATVRHNLLWCCDVTSPPAKSLLATLAAAAADARERLTLQFLASRDGRAAYRLDVVEGRPTLLQLLRRYPSCRPTAAQLLEALPPLRPRLYSLTNSPAAAPDALQCAFHVVEYATHWGPQQGVATTWLERATQGGAPPLRLPVHLRPSTGFRPPADASEPIIMVGPGTGVAPFRGFLQRRRAQVAAGGLLGESWLFFGNWRPDWDFLYEDELKSFVADGTLSHLVCAWSRETEKKVYVQHKMEAAGEQLCEALLERGASLFVCGDGAHMAKDVNAAVKNILVKHGDLDGQEADDFLKDLASQHKYMKDVWL